MSAQKITSTTAQTCTLCSFVLLCISTFAQKNRGGSLRPPRLCSCAGGCVVQVLAPDDAPQLFRGERVGQRQHGIAHTPAAGLTNFLVSLGQRTGPFPPTNDSPQLLAGEGVGHFQYGITLPRPTGRANLLVPLLADLAGRVALSFHFLRCSPQSKCLSGGAFVPLAVPSLLEVAFEIGKAYRDRHQEGGPTLNTGTFPVGKGGGVFVPADVRALPYLGKKAPVFGGIAIHKITPLLLKEKVGYHEDV